jgi:outer membrane protein assembly factor BamB
MRPRSHSVAVVALLAACIVPRAEALRALHEGDVVASDLGPAITIADGLPDSEKMLSGTSLLLEQLSLGGYCQGAVFAVDADGTAIAWDHLRSAWVRIDFATGAWHIVSGFGVGDGGAAMGELAIEPGGTFLTITYDFSSNTSEIDRVDPATGDRTLLLESPVPPPPPALPDYKPRLLATRPDGTIVFYSYAEYVDPPYISIKQRRLFQADPVTAAVSPFCFDPAMPDVTGLEISPNGDAVLAAKSAISRVDTNGHLSTLTGDGVGSGPALDDGLTHQIAIDEEGTIFTITDLDPTDSRAYPSVLAVDPATGDRTVVSDWNAPLGARLGVVEDLDIGLDGSPLALSCDNDVVRIDRETGQRTVAFDPEIGSGPPADWAAAPAIDRYGRVVLGVYGALLYLDPATGKRTTFSSDTVGDGLALTDVRSVALSPAGDVYVVPGTCRTKLLRVDPRFGHRTIVSGSVGSGPFWVCPDLVVTGADGFLYVTDDSLHAIFQVDPSTGNRVIVSDATHGSGPLASPPIAANPDGSLLASGGSGLVRIDPVTGVRTPFVDFTAGVGPSIDSMAGLAVGSDGAPLVLDTSSTGLPRQLIRIDPMTSNRTELATGLFYGIGVAPAIVPEPGAPMRALVAFALLALARRRRGPLVRSSPEISPSRR